MEKHALLPVHLRSVCPNIPTEFKPSSELEELDRRLAVANFSPEFIAELDRAKDALLYYRKSMVDGTIAARPTYVDEFTFLTAGVFESLFKNAVEKYALSEQKHALFFGLEALEYVHVDFFFDEKQSRYEFWRDNLVKFGQDADDIGKFASRMKNLSVLFGLSKRDGTLFQY